MTISLQALLALVLVHLETALLFEVAHESAGLGVVQRKPSGKHPAVPAVKPNLGRL